MGFGEVVDIVVYGSGDGPWLRWAVLDEGWVDLSRGCPQEQECPFLGELECKK